MSQNTSIENEIILNKSQQKLLSLWGALPKNSRNSVIKFDLKRKRNSSGIIDIIKSISERKHWSLDSTISSPNLFKLICQELETNSGRYLKAVSLLSIKYIAKNNQALLNNFLTLTEIEIPNGIIDKIEVKPFENENKLKEITDELVQNFNKDDIQLLYLAFSTFHIKNLDRLEKIALEYIDKVEIKEKIKGKSTNDELKGQEMLEVFNSLVNSLEEKLNDFSEKYKLLADKLITGIIPPNENGFDLNFLRDEYEDILKQIYSNKDFFYSQTPLAETHNYDLAFIKRQITTLKNINENNQNRIKDIFYSLIGLHTEDSGIQSKLDSIKKEFLGKYYNQFAKNNFEELSNLLEDDNPYNALIELVKNISQGDQDLNEKLHNLVVKHFDPSIGFRIISNSIRINELSDTYFNQYISSKRINSSKKLEDSATLDLQDIKQEKENDSKGKENREDIIDKNNMNISLPKEKIKHIKTKKEDYEKIEIPIKSSLEILETHKNIYEKIFYFINCNLYSAAYLLNFYVNSHKSSNSRKLPNWLIESIILANHLQEPEGELSTRLKELFDDYNPKELEYDDQNMNDSINLLLFSASIIPALRAPLTGASSILLNLRFNEKLDKLFKLIKEVIDFSNLGFALDKKYLKVFHDSYDIEKHKIELIEEVSIWLNRTENKKINYIPAKKVLSGLMKEGELIYNLVQPIIKNNLDTNKLKTLLNEISGNDDYLENEIIKTNRIVNQRMDKIDGFALNTILSKLKEAVRFSKEWLDLNNNRDGIGYDFIYNKSDSLRVIFNKLAEDIIIELKVFQNGNDILQSSSAYIATNSIILLKTFFNPTDNELIEENSVTDILEEDLVICSSTLWYKILDKIYNDNNRKINFEKFLDLLENDQKLSDEILNEFLNYSFDQNFYDLFKRHCEEGNHILTDKLLTRIINNNSDDLSVSDLVEEKSTSTKQFQTSLRNRIVSTKNMIEIGLTEDLISENQRNEFLGLVSSINVESNFNFGYLLYKLDCIQNFINNLKFEKKSKLLERINTSSLKNEEIKKLKSLLERDKLATTQTYLESIERGETLFEFPNDKTKLDEFLNSISKINSFLSEFDRSSLSLFQKIDSIKINENFGPIKLPSTKTQLVAIQELFSSWFKIKFDRSVNDVYDLITILKWLGFNVDEKNITQNLMSSNVTGNYKWFNFSTNNEVHSPIPQFGSLTNKKYKLLCVLQQESISKIIEIMKTQGKGDAVIIFNFWRIDEKGRRILCKTCYENRISPLVLDDILLFYLAGLKDSQTTEAFFEMTIPFCYALPFITAAGNVPREMFYGRKKEILDILNPKGTCIIYGGRQLGKTAILRKIFSEHSIPEEKKYIIFIDLKAKGYGISNQNPIWQLIGAELKNIGIMKNKQLKSFNQFEEEVRNWLNEYSDGRILVLLDEADKFIEIDANDNLASLAQLRGLMDDTNSRFKFVLSGLHNVQRFTKISNSTISHLLTRGSYCIGPLIGNGEQYEAVKLIVYPFKALGYKFENEEIVYKILNHTNYYPSLIQLFCDNLLKEMYEQINHKFDINQNPPFLITNNNIDDVYSRKQKLRKDIVDRFQWTLNLDPRYELIAYLIALLSSENSDLSREGITIQNISVEISRWKNELFKSDNRYEDLKDLLEEMIGLGILRRTSSNKYLLKDSNIFRLLGNKDDIEMKLVSINDKLPSIELELDSYRKNDSEKIFDLSPFTAKQENILLSPENAVVMIGGIKALGIQKSIRFIELAIKDSPTMPDHELLPLKVSTQQNFQTMVDNFLNKKDNYLSILIVPPEIMWDELWIKYAAEKINSKRSTNYLKKIVFFADESAIWSFINQSKPMYNELISKGLQEIRLRKMSLSMIDNWARDNMIDIKQEIIKNLGTWPGLYHKYLTRSENKILLSNPFNNEILKDEVKELKSFFGLTNDSIRELIVKMNDFGESISIEELYEWCDNIFPFNVLEDIIDWCNYFSLINQDKNGKYMLDPILSKIAGIVDER